MRFDYSYYFRACFVVSLMFGLFSLYVLVVVFFSICKKEKRNIIERVFNPKTLVFFCLVLIVHIMLGIIFAYSESARAFVQGSLGPWFFKISVVVFLIVGIIGSILKRKGDRFVFPAYFAGLCVSGLLLHINMGVLLHGGIYLVSEKESDAITMRGYISAIEANNMFEMPRMRTEYGYTHTNGEKITINNIRCKAPTGGILKEGDYVEVVYLPKSSYILSIDIVENK